MKYKMIAVDMDGTLVNDMSIITPRTKAAIAGAVEAGALFVTATGRSKNGIEIVNEIFDKDMPFVVFNGATAVMGKSGKVLFEKFLEFNLAKDVFELGISRGVPMVLWTGKHLWASCESKETRDYQKFYNNIEMKIISDLVELEAEGIFKVLWFSASEKTKQIQSEMKEFFSRRLFCYMSQPNFLEFVSPDAGKGVAIAEIGRLYGIDRSEMIAVGDSYNDISMLEYVGLAIAMGNAHDDVKAVCGHVTLSNNDDGAAAVIEKYF